MRLYYPFILAIQLACAGMIVICIPRLQGAWQVGAFAALVYAAGLIGVTLRFATR